MNYFLNILLKIWTSVKVSVRNEDCLKKEEKKKRNLKPNQHLWEKISTVPVVLRDTLLCSYFSLGWLVLFSLQHLFLPLCFNGFIAVYKIGHHIST